MAAKNIKTMKILGIDTSCDDTAIALLEFKNGEVEILSNIVSSQVKLHQKYGGVYPSLAKREHQKNLPLVFRKAMKKAKLALSSSRRVDLIAVTVGPGLEPCLWQGINFAQDLAKKFKKPLIPVNHIEAHILANWLTPISKIKNPKSKIQKLFPAVALVVSGGHTELILMKGIGKYQLIGETRDDAAGECLDKVARILRLGYPGGPIIAKLARNVRSSTPNKLPRPMLYQKNYDFSFSGLKTAVLYKVKEGNYDKIEMCYEVQQAVIDVLIHKTLKAAKNLGVKTIILGGGVAANEELRRQFKKRIKKEIPDSRFYVPDSKFCTDNAAMVAITAFFHQKEIKKNIEAEANLKI